MEFKRVVITGVGTVNPLGNSVDEFWNNLKNGVSGAAPIAKFDASKHKTQFACELKNFDATQYMDRKDIRKYDLYTQYALSTAEQAIQDSGLNLEQIDHDRAGVIWGAGIGGLQTFFEETRAYSEEMPRFSPFFIPLAYDQNRRMVRLDLSVIWSALAAVKYKKNELKIRDQMYNHLMRFIRESGDSNNVSDLLENSLKGILQNSLGIYNLEVKVREINYF